jgi:spore coat protein A
MMRKFLVTLALAGAGGVATGDTIVLDAFADATIYSDDDTRANGSGEFLFAGNNNGGESRRTLVRFNVLGSIPVGSEIHSVELRLYASRGGSGPVNLFPLLADWGEGPSNAAGNEGAGTFAQDGDATWAFTFYDEQDPDESPEWSVPGGDFLTPASASVNVLGINQFYSWSSVEMALDVESWLESPGSDFGWILVGNESSSSTSTRFNSRTNPDPATRPQLIIEFTPPPGAGSCCFVDGSCIITTEGSCTGAGGTFNGVGTSCSPNPCPVPTGACCMPDGSCVTSEEGDCVADGGIYQGHFTDCSEVTCSAVLTPYLDPMPIPPVAQPILGTPGGFATYNIRVQRFRQQLHSQLPPTVLWGYEGTYPGPTIEAGAGELAVVNWINDLRDDEGEFLTRHELPVDLCPHGASDDAKHVTHVHGAHTPPEFDGYPEDTFLPGEQDTYLYLNEQLPATLWYHDHSLGQTRLNVYLGEAGFFIIRDEFENSLGLPSGEFEVPMLFQDRSFNQDGSLQYPGVWEGMFHGDYNLVNGMVWPYFEVKRAKYRFRWLNGANSRTYTLSLSDGTTFDVIGMDGGLRETPVTLSEITLAPAERVDILIDFSDKAPGTEILLTNSASAPFDAPPGTDVLPEVMKFIVTEETGPTPPTPALLRPFDAIAETEARISRDFVLQQHFDDCTGLKWLINGLHWSHITERVEKGSTEIWRFVNPSGMTHPMHIHLVSFQVLDRQPMELVDGVPVPTGPATPPGPEDQFWKDTVKVFPGEMVRVIAKFEDYTGLFAYHCHILEHEDQEMMRQYLVVNCLVDLAPPEGVLDFSDIAAFLTAFADGTVEADLAPPLGTFDFSDVFEFLVAFAAGCPD